MPESFMRPAGETARPIPRRLSFTQRNLAEIAPPATPGDRVWVYDTRTNGLAFQVTATGARAFYFYGRIKGRPNRLRLGLFPSIGVEQARKLAVRYAAAVSEGIDPQERKRVARAEMKFGDLFTWFMDHHAKPHKRSWAKDQQRYDTHLAKWAGRPLSAITRDEVQRLHLAIGKTKPGAANRTLALLSTIFNKARLIGYDQSNPAAGVPHFKEKSRERYLTAEELPRFFAALEAEPDPTWRDFFAMCLWTGARSGNVMAMRWDEIREAAGQWIIPATKAKAGDALTVHLAAPALEILKSRKTDGAEWVFPSSSTSGHIMRPNGAWQALCTRAGFTDLWIHDLRRTLGSWQAASGASLQVIGKSLGHRSIQATAIYSRLNLDPVKVSVDAATAAMKAAAKAEPKKK